MAGVVMAAPIQKEKTHSKQSGLSETVKKVDRRRKNTCTS